MAQVSIRINGYAYSVGCEDGQEDHLQAMAAQVEDRVSRIKRMGGQSGESRLLVLAALLMADELHDLGAVANTGDAAPARDARLARHLAQLADQAEGIAARLAPA
jgi:cell division protein ZapA